MIMVHPPVEFKCFLFVYSLYAFQGPQPGENIHHDSPGFCRLMPWPLQEPALRVLATRLSRRVFLHLLRGSDLAGSELRGARCGMLEYVEMRLPR